MGVFAGENGHLCPQKKEIAMSNETSEIIEALRTPAGGFTKKGLESIGVPWPPPKGWIHNLISENALADKSNVLYFPRNQAEPEEQEETWRLAEFHFLTSEYKILKDLAIKNRKDIPSLIIELAKTYGEQIEPYRHPVEFEDE